MALIRRIGFTRFNRWGDNLGRLTVSAATHTDALDGTDELNITCAEDLVKGDRIVWIDLQGTCHEHIVDTIDRVHDDDGAPETQAVCINSINETWDDWLDDNRPSGSVAVALASILADTRWEVGTCDQGGSASRTFYHESVREGLAGIIETWGGELETLIVHDGASIVSRRVGVRAKRGNQSSAKRFTWTKDLVSVKRSVASDNPKTRVYGYGKGVETEGGGYGRRLTFGDINDGKDYVEDAEATAVWGHPDGDGGILPAVASYVNEQCEDAAQLLQETLDYLEQVKEPKVTYTASVIDLYAFGRSWEGVGVGDDVAIIDKGFSAEGVRLHGRVSQIERDLLTGDATVTFGTLTDTMADMWHSVNNALKSNSQQNALYDAAAGTSVSWLQQLQAALNAQFNAVGTYKVETFELGTMWSNVPIDAETGLPVKATSGMWAVNINGMGMRLAANLASDGQWDWRTFLTGAMVSADAINTGTMRAERVRAGLLTDEKGKNRWDLTSGEFSLSASTEVGGKTVQKIADDAASSAVDAQTQRDIFNKLTNNGQTQGIYLKDGKVYINGTYIQSGTISGDYIRGGTIDGQVIHGGSIVGSHIESSSYLFTGKELLGGKTTRLSIDGDGLTLSVDGTDFLASVDTYGITVKTDPNVNAVTGATTVKGTVRIGQGNSATTTLNTYAPISVQREGESSQYCVVSENSNNYRFVFNVTSGSYLEIQTLFGAYGLSAFASDARMKESITDSASDAMSIIRAIKHRSFRWKDLIDKAGERHLGGWVDCGYVAQELEEVDKRFAITVGEGTEGERKQISEQMLIPYITKAIQELDERVTKIENMIGVDAR